MRILVTGGAGYLGSVLVPLLLDAGHGVRVLDDLRYGQHLALAACAANPNFEFTLGDARYDVTEAMIEWCDAIVPLAALVGAPLCAAREHEAFEANYKAIANLVEHSDAVRDKLIVYPNTNSGYGATGDAPVTEDAPLNPISEYGRWKCRAEDVLRTVHPNSVVLRLATVYGFSPRMRLDLLVNDFVNRALRDRTLVLYQGHFRRSVIHVRDVARAFLHVIENHGGLSVPWRIFNVASENVTKRRLAELIQRRVSGLQVIDDGFGEDPDKRDYGVSSERLLSTGFRFAYPLDDGIDELVRGLPMIPQHRYGNV